MRRTFNLLIVLLFALASKSAISAVLSDDFHAQNINSSVWSIVDPVGDTTISVDASRISINIPQGTPHDLWSDGSFASRIMQATANDDFEAIVKFESIPSLEYQIQGLLVEADNSNYIRFDMYSDGVTLNMFSAAFVNDSPSIKANVTVPLASVYYLKVGRVGDTWTYSYSVDNLSWIQVVSFVHNIGVTSVGVFGGNAGNNPPAFQVLADYFFDSGSPISPEDNGLITDTFAPNIYNEKFVENSTQIDFSFWLDEAATATVSYGLTPSLELGTVNTVTSNLRHTATIGGLSALTTYYFNVVATDSSFNVLNTGLYSTTTLAGGVSGLSLIDIWYGNNQVFGNIGTPQRWINILGNLNPSATVTAFEYSLNGGTYNPLTVGPDNIRLQNAGDFNVELDIQTVLEGNNTLELRVQDGTNIVSTKTISFTYSSANSWPAQYSIDWSTVSNIQDVAQIVDGKWVIEGSSIRTVETGYDRLIAIGEMSAWHDYEVVVPVTVNSIDTTAYQPGIGILFRWDGHYAWDWKQPTNGWWPMGALAWYRYDFDANGDRLNMIGNEASQIAVDGAYKQLQVGVSYFYKFRVETPAGQGSWYRFKVWKQTDPEPANWDLEAQELTTDPQLGSFLLLAHHVDASFGNVTVTPIAGAPSNNPPVISAVAMSTTSSDATISWTTDKPADSVLEFGLDASYGNIISDATLVTSHSITVNGLSAGTLYYFRVASTDNLGLTTTGSGQTFTTATAGTPPVNSAQSDYFGSTSLDPIWTVVDPLGDGTISVNGSQLVIAVPQGVSHDAWTSGNDTVRINQSMSAGDFEAEVKFDSLPVSQYQLQGMLVEQDNGNFIRFDFYHDGANLNIFAAAFNGGSPTVMGNTIISGGSPLYMRVKRVGDIWTQSYSYDGSTWVVATTFSYVLNTTGVSLFAGNAGGNPPAFTALVDHFLIAAGTLPTVDLIAPVVSNVLVSKNGTQATITWDTNEPATSILDYGLTASYEIGQLSDATLVTSHSMTLTGLSVGSLYYLNVSAADSAGNISTPVGVTFVAEVPLPPVISNISLSATDNSATISWTTDKPATSVIDYGLDISYGGIVSSAVLSTSHSLTINGLLAATLYHFQVSGVDAQSLNGVSADQTFTTVAAPVIPPGSVSDSFNTVSLDPMWSILDPRADGLVSVNGSQLALDVPAGISHDIWSDGNNALRVMQPASDTDFIAEVKFDSTPSSQYQLQGLLVEQDSNNFLRFDFYSDGGNLYVFAASFVSGSPTVQANNVIASGSPLYMRVTRVGNQWTQSFSYDGIAWNVMATFSFTMTANNIGVFAGNAGGSAPAYTALVDYLIFN